MYGLELLTMYYEAYTEDIFVCYAILTVKDASKLLTLKRSTEKSSTTCTVRLLTYYTVVLKLQCNPIK